MIAPLHHTINYLKNNEDLELIKTRRLKDKKHQT